MLPTCGQRLPTKWIDVQYRMVSKTELRAGSTAGASRRAAACRAGASASSCSCASSGPYRVCLRRSTRRKAVRPSHLHRRRQGRGFSGMHVTKLTRKQDLPGRRSLPELRAITSMGTLGQKAHLMWGGGTCVEQGTCRPCWCAEATRRRRVSAPMKVMPAAAVPVALPLEQYKQYHRRDQLRPTSHQPRTRQAACRGLVVCQAASSPPERMASSSTAVPGAGAAGRALT